MSAYYLSSPNRLPIVSGSALGRRWVSERQNMTGAPFEDEDSHLLVELLRTQR